MPDPITRLGRLNRPQLLVRAAHLNLVDYRRERSLKSLVAEAAGCAGHGTFDALCLLEAELEAARQSGGAGYSIARHVEVLAAMIFEARLAGRSAA